MKQRYWVFLLIGVFLPCMLVQAQDCMPWVELQSGEHSWEIGAGVWTPHGQGIVYPGEYAEFRINIDLWPLKTRGIWNYTVAATFYFTRAERADLCLWGTPQPLDLYSENADRYDYGVSREWREPDCWYEPYYEPCQEVFVGFFNVSVTVHEGDKSESGWETIGRAGHLAVAMRWWPETITVTKTPRVTLYTVAPTVQDMLRFEGFKQGKIEGLLLGGFLGGIIGALFGFIGSWFKKKERG